MQWKLLPAGTFLITNHLKGFSVENEDIESAIASNNNLKLIKDALPVVRERELMKFLDSILRIFTTAPKICQYFANDTSDSSMTSHIKHRLHSPNPFVRVN